MLRGCRELYVLIFAAGMVDSMWYKNSKLPNFKFFHESGSAVLSLAPLRVIVDRGKENGETCMQPL